MVIGDWCGVSAGVNDDNAGVNAGVSAGVKLSDTQKRVLDLIAVDTAITQKELAQRLNKNETTILRAIKRLKNSGLIIRIGSDKSGYWKVVEKE